MVSPEFTQNLKPPKQKIRGSCLSADPRFIFKLSENVGNGPLFTICPPNYPASLRRPRRLYIIRGVVGEPRLSAAVGVHDVDLSIAISTTTKSDPGAVR